MVEIGLRERASPTFPFVSHHYWTKRFNGLGPGLHSWAKVLLGVKTRLLNFLYNEDRSVASLAGAPPQETISSEIGRHDSNPIDEEAADVLDAIQKDHVENAALHADRLDATDNGQEQ